MADSDFSDPRALISRTVVLHEDAAAQARVQTGIEYRVAKGEPLHFDLYLPAAAAPDAGYPVVLLVIGYSDLGARRIFGCDLKDFAAYDGWARLIAARGMAAVIYQSHEPETDIAALYEYLKVESGTLGLDTTRVGVWSCSGNVPNALGFLFERPELVCAALSYGYMLDLGDATAVADAAQSFGFVPAANGRSLDELPAVPMLVVRAGRDELPGLNASIDGFARAAAAQGLPVEVMDLPDAPHAYDIMDDSDASRAAIVRTLSFLKSALV